MKTGFEIAYELGSALKDLSLALPRHIWALGRARKARERFQRLENSPHPDEAPLPPVSGKINRIVLSCGDASGESHAIKLVQELLKRHPDLHFEGFGGSRLQTCGMQVWSPLADLNIMGFKDVAAQLPLFIRCVRRFIQEIDRHPPDAVVLIDYPGLNRHLLRIAARRRIPVVNLIAPQLWAWASWRIRDFRRADRLLTILPFETSWYEQYGASAQYIGHPIGDSWREAHRHESGAPEALLEPAEWIGILPGSRKREVRENLPLLLKAAATLRAQRPATRFVLPHLRADLWPLMETHLKAYPQLNVVPAPGCFHAVLPRLHGAWVASGTALLEVACHRIPMVLVYGLSSRLADWLSKHALAVPFVGSLNLIAGREIVPEHVGRRLEPNQLAADLQARLEPAGREKYLQELESLLPYFATPGTTTRAVAAVEGVSLAASSVTSAGQES